MQNTTKMQWVNFESQRFYTAVLHQDLLKDWVVTLRWGSLTTRRSLRKTKFCHDEKTGLKLLKQLHRLRSRHGYQIKESKRAKKQENRNF